MFITVSTLLYMNKLLLLILLLIPAFSLQAQVSNVVFIGSINVKDGEAFSYKIQVTDSNGTLTGYSVTDVMGPNETKTLIKGSINANQKSLKFRETKVVSTKTKTGSALCFVHANLKASKKKGTTILRGSFTGYGQDGVSVCATGTMILVSASDVMDKLMKSDLKKDTTVTKSLMKVMASEEPTTPKETVVYQTESAVPDSKVMKVTPGSTKEFTHSVKSAKMEVWDAKTIDGDMITVVQNGKILLENYRLSGIHKELNINLRTSMADTIKIIAVNEGSEPLNTARARITMGTDIQYIDASTTLDKPIWIVLKNK